MKQLITLLLILGVCTCVRAQVDPEKTSGFPTYPTKPTHTPSVRRGAEVAWVLDSQRFYFFDREVQTWRPYRSGSTTSGTPSQAIESDGTLTGTGESAEPLGVDTTLIASREYVDIRILAQGQRVVEYTATGGESSISIPFQVDTSRPQLVQRNGVGQSIGGSGQVTLTGTTYIINGVPLQAGERIKIFLYELQ